MSNNVSYDKMSKKEKALVNAKKRRRWSDYGDISVITKATRNKKHYCRTQSKSKLIHEIRAEYTA